MRCADAPRTWPRDKALLATGISLRCIKGACGETDFAATYLTVLRRGYVHNLKGEMFLVNPRRDFWQSGAEGGPMTGWRVKLFAAKHELARMKSRTRCYPATANDNWCYCALTLT